MLSHLVGSNFVTPRTVACHPPPSMGFSRQEFWSGLPFPSPGDLLHSGIETAAPVTPSLQADSLPAEPQSRAGGGSPCCASHPCNFIYLSCAGSLSQSVGSPMLRHTALSLVAKAGWRVVGGLLLLWSSGSRVHRHSSCNMSFSRCGASA